MPNKHHMHLELEQWLSQHLLVSSQLHLEDRPLPNGDDGGGACGADCADDDDDGGGACDGADSQQNNRPYHFQCE